MAATNTAISPKEFEVWIIAEATYGTSAIHASNMYQLDVDSIGMPSLNENQSFDIRSTDTGGSRTFVSKDVFQDNILKVTEFSISGRLHNDVGQELLLRNIVWDTTTGDGSNIGIGTSPEVATLNYGQSLSESGYYGRESFTIVIKAPQHSSAQSFEMRGCVCTNFSISADVGTDGGLYTYSATIQSGLTVDATEGSALAGTNVYVNTDLSKLSSATALEVLNQTVVMQSFTVTVDSPAVFFGAGAESTTNGFNTLTRAPELSVTADTTIKYDANTMEFINTFDTQTAMYDGDAFKIVNDDKWGVDIQSVVLTNVAMSEGDLMMLDVSLKAVDNGTDNLVLFDIA